jgi:quercetin 2,3-dioxygenase
MIQKLFATLKPAQSTREPGQAKAFVVRAGEDLHARRTILFGACPNSVKVSSRTTDGALCMFEYEGHVQGGPPLHVHHDQDEIYFIRSGQFTFEVGGARHELSDGDTIFLPRGVPHTFVQRSERGRLVFMFTPAGSMESYFEALSMLEGPPVPELEAELFRAHGMSVLGPPLPPY